MSGALVGFRIGGVNKLMRLHGERSVEQILCHLLAYLRSVRGERLRSYAGSLQLVDLTRGPYPSPETRARVESFFQDYLEESLQAPAWSDVFEVLAELEAWYAGFPFLPDADMQTCGDVTWGFVVNLDLGALQVHINRHGHFAWADLARQSPFCTIPLAAPRKMSDGDAHALSEILQAHSWSDGLDPVLPAEDGLSPPFPGPGGWSARLRVSGRRFRMLLCDRDSVTEIEVGMLGELRFNDPGCGAFLRSVVDPGLLSLGQAIYGPGLSLADAARLAYRMEDIAFLPGAGGLPLLDLGLRQSAGFALHPGSSYFDRLKAAMLNAGLSKQGWRFLIKQNAPALRSLLEFFRPSVHCLAEFSQYVNLLACAMQNEVLRPERCQPALRGLQWILKRAPEKADPVRLANASIFLRALMRAELSACEEANLVHEAQLVSDFLHARLSPLLPTPLPWQALCRRSRVWQRAAWARITPEQDVHWDALLPTYDAGTYEAVELNTGAGLLEEGLEQRHCVGNYSNACASGSCRIFSLRLHGRRVATIELRREPDGKWCMGQVRGKANHPIEDQDLLVVAGRLVAAYAAAQPSFS
jgi:hypothetical protein